MSVERIRSTVPWVLDRAYSGGDLQVLDGIYATHVLCHRPPLPDVEGLDILKEIVTDLRSAFSDIDLSLQRIIVDGEAHAVLWAFQATHTGQSPVMPIPSTFRRVNITGSTICLWAGGQIVEEWHHVDWLGLFRQLGVIPPMG
jgi:predicted ester cyclase